MMKKILWLLTLLFGSSLFSPAQDVSSIGTLPDYGKTLPATCDPPQIYFLTSIPVGLQQCVAHNTWAQFSASSGINPQTGTTYTITQTDNGKLVAVNNGTGTTITLPAASSVGSSFAFDLENLGVGLVTITPASGTIDLLSSVTVATNTGTRVFSDGTNWNTQRGGLGSLLTANALIELTGVAQTARTNIGAYPNTTTVQGVNGAGTLIPSCTLTNQQSGDIYQWDGTKCINAEPGLPVNAQTGTSYAIVGSTDKSKHVTFANGSAIAVSIAQAGTGAFDAVWFSYLDNINAAGGSTVTLTPATSTCNLAATCTLTPGEWGLLISDGANYRLMKGRPHVLPVANGGTGITSSGALGQVLASTGSVLAMTDFPHVIEFTIDGGGSAIATGALGVFVTAEFACTINRVNVSSDQSGSITVDIWKVAKSGSNRVIPTSSNKISASSPATLSSAQISTDTTMSGWSTLAVVAGDTFGGQIQTSATVTRVTVQIICQ